MRHIIVIIIVLGFTSCTYNSSEKTIESTSQVNTISILLSGRGREFVINSPKDTTVIPAELSREIYLFELERNGKLKTSFGYGEEFSIEGSSKKNDLQMNMIEQQDSIFLDENKLNKFFLMVDEIYSREEYISKSAPSDSWLVKLNMNTKTNIYFVGEHIWNDILDRNYMDLIDMLVKESPIKVKYYR